jgi:hypothetical protein
MLKTNRLLASLAPLAAVLWAYAGGQQTDRAAPLVAPAAAPPAAENAALVRVIDTAQWSPPSPDPSGLTYWPARGTLLVVDGEVDEMPQYFVGANVFEATIAGQLVATYSTTAFSVEPAGIDIAVNPGNGHFFISDDTHGKHVFEIDLGPDGSFGSADDIVTSFSTTVFGNDDPEGLTYGQGKLYITDGAGDAVFILDPGANGRFDGVPPAGDDKVGSFSTSGIGVQDPEGIEFNPDTGTLYIVGTRGDLAEATTSGALVRAIDVTFLDAVALADVALAPSSQNSAAKSLYLADRGVDNGQDPNENDGKIYEITLGDDSPPGTPTPSRTGTPTQPTNIPIDTPTPTSGSEIYKSHLAIILNML